MLSSFSFSITLHAFKIIKRDGREADEERISTIRGCSIFVEFVGTQQNLNRLDIQMGPNAKKSQRLDSIDLI